jgi:ribosomal protein S19
MMRVFKKRNEKINVYDVGQNFFVHFGTTNKKLKIGVIMVGHKFGEFVQTRKLTRRNKKPS